MKISKKETSYLYENSPLKKIVQKLLVFIQQLKEKHPKEDTLEYENAYQWVIASEVVLNTLDKTAPKLEGYQEDISLSSLIAGLASDFELIKQVRSLQSLSRTCRLIELSDSQKLPTTVSELLELLNSHNAIILQGDTLYCANVAQKTLKTLEMTSENKKNYDQIKSQIRAKKTWADSDTVASIRAIRGNSLMAPKIHHPLMYELILEIIQIYIRAPKELEVLVPFLNPAIIQVDFFKDPNSDEISFPNPITEIVKKVLGYYFKIEHVGNKSDGKHLFNYDYTEAKDKETLHKHINGSTDYGVYKQDKINENLNEIIRYLKGYRNTPHAISLKKSKKHWKLEYERRFEAIRMRIEACQFTADLPLKVEKLTAIQIASEIQQNLDLQNLHNPPLKLELEQFLEMIPGMSVFELLAQKKYREDKTQAMQLAILKVVDEKTEEKIAILKAAWKKRIEKDYENMFVKPKQYEAILNSLPKAKSTKADEKTLKLITLESKENIKTLSLIDLVQIKENCLKILMPQHFKIENDESFNKNHEERIERFTNYMDSLIETKNHLHLVFEKQIQESNSELLRLEAEKERLKREAEFALKMKNLNIIEIADLVEAENLKLNEKQKELEAHLALQEKVQESFDKQFVKSKMSFQKAEKNIKQKEEWIESLTLDALNLARELPKVCDDKETLFIEKQLAHTKDLLAKPTNLPSLEALEKLESVLNAPENDRCIPFNGMEESLEGPINTLLSNLGCSAEQIGELDKFRAAEETYFSKPGHNTRIKFRTLINTFIEDAKNKIQYLDRLAPLVKNIDIYQDAILRNSEDKVLDVEEMKQSSLEIERIKSTIDDNQRDALSKKTILNQEKVVIENKYESLKWCFSILKCMESFKNALELFVNAEQYDDGSAIHLENLYQELIGYTSQNTFDPTIVDNIKGARLAFCNTIDIPKTIEDKYRPVLGAIDFSEADKTYTILSGPHALSHSEFLEAYNQLVNDILRFEVQLNTEHSLRTNGVAKQMVMAKLTLLSELKQKVGTLGLTYQTHLMELLNNQAANSVLFVGDMKESRDMKAANEGKIQSLDDFLSSFPAEILLQAFTNSVANTNPPLENPQSLVAKRQDLVANLNEKRILNGNLDVRITDRQTEADVILLLLAPHLSKRVAPHPIHELNLEEKLRQFVETGDDSDMLDLITHYLTQFPGTYMKGILSKTATFIIDTKRKIPNQYERVEAVAPLDENETIEVLLRVWENNLNANDELQTFVDAIQKMALLGDNLPASESVIVKNLSDNLQADLHQFLQQYKDIIPTPKVFNTFSKEFLFRLHSEDEIMGKHRALWKPIVFNITIAATIVGILVIALQLVISKVQTGRARFFLDNTAKEKQVGVVDGAFNDWSHVISSEAIPVM